MMRTLHLQAGLDMCLTMCSHNKAHIKLQTGSEITRYVAGIGHLSIASQLGDFQLHGGVWQKIW